MRETWVGGGVVGVVGGGGGVVVNLHSESFLW